MVRVREHEAARRRHRRPAQQGRRGPRHRDAHRVPHLLPARPRRGVLARRRGRRLSANRRPAARAVALRAVAASARWPRPSRSQRRAPAAPLSTAAEPARVDRRPAASARSRSAARPAAAAVQRHQRGRRVEQHRVAHRPAPPRRGTGGPPRRCAPRRRRAARPASAAGQADVARARPALGSPRRRAPPTPARSWSVVSSSSPSSPRKTSADVPRSASTCGHHAGHPRVGARRPPARDGWAGLASGPRKLKIVGTPSSRRGVGRVPQRRVEHAGRSRR